MPEILYEDYDILAINKPAGLIVHSDGRTEEPSVAEWFIGKFPGAKDVGEPWISPQGEEILRSGIVHRLDRETSGVLLLAKTKEAHASLKSQFQAREVEKVYESFVYGHLKEGWGKIEMEICRTKNIPRKWIALPHRKKGEARTLREAITYWRVLRLGEDGDAREKFSYIEVKPKTGRTHQIRVHFKAINHPVVCDKIYAPKKPCLLNFGRLALHARKITFKDLAGEPRTITAPYPEDFQEAFATIGFNVLD